MRARPEHISVRKKPPIHRRPDLTELTLLNQSRGVQPAVEMLRQRVVLRRRRSPEMVERQAEPPIDIGLDRVLLVAEGSHILPGLDGAEFSRRSVFIGAADKEDIVADLPHETCMDVGRQKRADEIAEVLYAVHIWKRTGNENLWHGSGLSRMRMPNPGKSKSPPARPEGLGFGLCLGAKNARAIPSGRTPCGRAGAFELRDARLQKSLRNLRELAQNNTPRQKCQMRLIRHHRAA
jgi:hypothetical protein